MGRLTDRALKILANDAAELVLDGTDVASATIALASIIAARDKINRRAKAHERIRARGPMCPALGCWCRLNYRDAHPAERDTGTAAWPGGWTCSLNDHAYPYPDYPGELRDRLNGAPYRRPVPPVLLGPLPGITDDPLCSSDEVAPLTRRLRLSAVYETAKGA